MLGVLQADTNRDGVLAIEELRVVLDKASGRQVWPIICLKNSALLLTQL